MARQFISRWVYNARTGQYEEELDTVRGVYPYTLASGYHAWGAGSTGVTSLVAVPSGYRFQLGFIWIYNGDPSASVNVAFYDGAGTSVPVGRIPVATAAHTIQDWQTPWLVFASSVNASVDTSLVEVRVAGILVESGPE